MSLAGSCTAVLTALNEELLPIIRRLGGSPHPQAPSLWQTVVGGRRIIMGASGMGRVRSMAAAEELIRMAQPDSLVLAGFCGALDPAMVPGDLVVAERVTWSGMARDEDRVPAADLIAHAHATRAPGLRVAYGAMLSHACVLGRAEKLRLAGQHGGAIAVDMEAAGAAESAGKHGVPWISVRSVTDRTTDEMPLPFSALAGCDGQTQAFSVALAAITHPWAIPSLFRLGLNARRASRSLADYLAAFLGE